MVPNLPWIEEALMVRSRPADLVSCARNAEEKRLLHPLGPVLAISVKSRRVTYGDAEYRFGNDLDQTWTFNFGGKYVF